MNNGKNQHTLAKSKRVELGQYIVADPAICHGGVTFKGTRIFVADVLADVERGLSWDISYGLSAASTSRSPSQ